MAFIVRRFVAITGRTLRGELAQGARATFDLSMSAWRTFRDSVLDVWSWLRWCAMMLIISAPLYDFHVGGQTNTTFKFQAISTGVLLKCVDSLYFLRGIKGTGFLVRMVTEIVMDMRPFLFIMTLTTLAFAVPLTLIRGSVEESWPDDEPSVYH